MSDTAACDALSCDKRPDPRCPYCRGTGRVDAADRLRVIIAGSRTVKSYAAVLQAIQSSGFRVGEVVSGGCAGPDCMGEGWAQDNRLPVRRFEAKWKDFGDRAGPIRNAQMAEYADALIAIWDGQSRGTASMISEMRRLGKPVHVHRIDVSEPKPKPRQGELL